MVLTPSGVYVDCQRPFLNTADVLWCRAQFPGNCEAALEERGGYRGSEHHTEIVNETAQRVEHRHDLRGVTESMSGDRGPDQGHTKRSKRVNGEPWNVK